MTGQQPRATKQATSIKLKGIELPIFSGNKTEYEAWKAVFMSVIDESDIPIREKMLHLRSYLRGKALDMVKDLGYSTNTYERLKEKLEKRFGRAKQLQIKHLAVLRDWLKLRYQDLEELEEFLAVLEQVLVAHQDSGSDEDLLKNQHLILTVKEKLPE